MSAETLKARLAKVQDRLDGGRERFANGFKDVMKKREEASLLASQQPAYDGAITPSAHEAYASLPGQAQDELQKLLVKLNLKPQAPTSSEDGSRYAVATVKNNGGMFVPLKDTGTFAPAAHTPANEVGA
jgi:hypothetical protein